jgi:hypothetical protein
MKQRLKYGYSDNYNWQTRIKWYPAGWGFNKRVIGDQHSRLHYLACHAPDPIKKRWDKAYENFMAKHFGTKGKASMRYLNTWSCHSWM